MNRAPCATCAGRLVFVRHRDAKTTGAPSAYHKTCGWPPAWDHDKGER